MTAVMIAAERGSPIVMRQLVVEHNANLNLQDNVRLSSKHTVMYFLVHVGQSLPSLLHHCSVYFNYHCTLILYIHCVGGSHCSDDCCQEWKN